MIESRAEVVIERPPEAVFDFLADSRNEERWLPGAERVELLDPEPIGLGTRFRGRYARTGEVALELVEFERPSRVTFRARSRIVDFDDAVVLTPKDGGTLLRATMRAQPKGMMRFVAPLMGRTMSRQFQSNWTCLKRALEAAPAASS